MHRKALLEKSAQTGQVKAEIEGLNRDIRDSEARLSEAQKQFDDITASLDNLKASLTAPLVNIRQNLAQLDTYRLEQHSAYEDKRKTAEEICNTRQAAPATSAAQPQAEEETDRFPQARKDADEARNAYEKVDMENIREAERLLKTRRCQIARVSGLLDRTSEFLDSWLSAEKVYWTSWNEAETKRVEGQKKYLTSRESDRQLAAHLVEVHKQDREELIHRKALLEKSAQTGQIKAEIDALNRDTQDNEARLSKAQKQFEDITSSLKNSEASLRARRMIIRQNLAQLDTYRLKQHAAYEGKRKTAEDICTTHSD
jgi:chromosome segregation ATPase